MLNVLSQDWFSTLSKLKIARSGLEMIHKMKVETLANSDTKEEGKDSRNLETLSSLKSLLDVVVKISQDTKNDKLVAESGILKVMFQFLSALHEGFASKM